jgi:hypothetical protein
VLLLSDPDVYAESMKLDKAGQERWWGSPTLEQARPVHHLHLHNHDLATYAPTILLMTISFADSKMAV